MKKWILLIGLIGQFNLVHATNHCADLIGTWEGAWYEPNKPEKLTYVTFTNIDDEGYFKGDYVFKDAPQSIMQFSGYCTATSAGFDQLAFKAMAPQSNVCAGLYNDKKELWMGCPFIQSGAIYHRKLSSIKR
ncbi:MAG: hypothetical protein K0U37_07330 [Gammaproteobacteria bacterium]|nr:hypothetical protein [Gammaproteobacteria bacterium]